jgi:hypothetical protein
MKVAPAPMRTRIEDALSGLRVVIPAKRSWGTVLFICLWLCGWVMGELSAIGALFGLGPFQSMAHGKHPAPNAFLFVWLLAWTAGGAFALYTVIWCLVGREVITLDGQALVVWHEPLPFPPKREFDWAQVKNLRISPQPSPRRSNLQLGFGGPIAFDYGAKTWRFGIDLDEAEAGMLLDSIRRRFQLAE